MNSLHKTVLNNVTIKQKLLLVQGSFTVIMDIN